MRKVIAIIPFVLLSLGTLGLLLDELVFDWGRMSILLFTVSNVIGLIILIILGWSRKKD